MALVEWRSEYSVRVQSIDSQHQKIFEMINELYDAMRAGDVAQVVPAILHRLAEYCRTHFADEEKMMLQAEYPNYIRHRAEHNKLTKEVLTMEKDFHEDRVMRSLALLRLLNEWIQRHIISADQQYTSHLQAAGIQ